MSKLIIDSCLSSLDEAVQGLEFPREIRDRLVLVHVEYYSFDGQLHAGQLVVNRDIEEHMHALFAHLREIRFPVERVVPIMVYGWDDDASMAANNTSAFNYRFVSGTEKLSEHSKGYALDLNPRQNPFIGKSGEVIPAGVLYDTSVPGTLTGDSSTVLFLKKRGFDWGGDWKDDYGIIDYQHFEVWDRPYEQGANR